MNRAERRKAAKDQRRMCAKDIYALMQLDVADGVTPQEIKDMLLYTDY